MAGGSAHHLAQRRRRRSEHAGRGPLCAYVRLGDLGRRNRYHIQAHLPLPEPDGRERTVGEILALLTGTDASTTKN
jgi:hypothetical protein